MESVDAFIAAAGDATSIQVGYYQLKKEMKAADAFDILSNPANIIKNTVTIPEGLRVADVVAVPVGMRTFTVATARRPTWPGGCSRGRSDWRRWSPHVRGAWGLGDPEVRRGAGGAARLLGVVPSRRADHGQARGPLLDLARRRRGDGRTASSRAPAAAATVAIDLSAPGPLEPALALAYGPLIEVSLHRLAQEAERVVGTPAR